MKKTLKTPGKIVEVINEFSQVVGYTVNKQNSFCFYSIIMNYQKEKLRKQSHLQLLQNNKIPKNKLNQAGKRPVH